MEIRPVEAELLHADEQTDMTNLIVAFRSFSKAPKERTLQVIDPTFVLNLSKPTGYVMHHQFNIQQLYALPTLYLCVLYLSQNKQRLLSHTT
jgi:hypothetical protein